MKNFIKILNFVLLTMCSFVASTQTLGYTVEGKVIVGEGEEVFEGYEVFFILENGADIVTYTDEQGEYEQVIDFGAEGELLFVSGIDYCTGEFLEYTLIMTEGGVAEIDFHICTDIAPPPPPEDCDAYFWFEDFGDLTLDFFDLSYSPNGVETWSWDFGDGTTSMEQNPTHTYLEEGTYEVILTIQEEDCESTITQSVFIHQWGCGCDAVYDPVCIATPGGGFLEFSNACIAECEGFDPIHFVECDFQLDCFADFIYYQQPEDSLTIIFTDFSIGEIYHWEWDFGDGSTAAEPHVEHTYTAAGEYIVTLTVSGNDCEDTIEFLVYVGSDFGNCFCPEYYAPVCVHDFWTGEIIEFPNDCFAECEGYFWYDFLDCETGGEPGDCHAYFEYNQNEDNPLLVNFINLSDYEGEANFFWEFGDGNHSTEEIPFHTYEEGGIYNVTLFIESDSCHDVISIPVFLHGDCPWFPVDCQALFDYFEEPSQDLTLFFNDFSQGEVLSWNWTFGDDHSSTEPHPLHTYAEMGIYEVSLEILTVDSCHSSITTEVWVGFDDTPEHNCQAIFGFFQTAVSTFTINFEDYSLGDVETWDWDFGDGHASTASNPTHTYSEAGEYIVTLSITTIDGCQSTIEYPIYVTDQEGDDWFPVDCQANFFFEYGNDPMTIQFEDFSHGEVTDWTWHFGNGDYSNEQSPTYTYPEAGIFIVNLEIATAEGCLDDFQMEVWVGEDTYDFPVGCQAFFTVIINDNEVSFQDQSSADSDIVNWFWDFGDGHTSHEQNPVHTYADTSAAVAILFIETAGGCISLYLIEIDFENDNLTGNPFFALINTTEEMPVVQSASIYPNPVGDYLNLSFTTKQSQNLSLQIVNNLGQQMDSYTVQTTGSDQTMQIDVSALHNGMHTLVIKDESTIQSLRFIKL